MKKQYELPEFELVRFNFGNVLEETDGGFSNLTHSVPQGAGEGDGEW